MRFVRRLVSRNIIKTWLPLAALASLLCGLGYGLSQQVVRQSADDDLVQLAEDSLVTGSSGQTLGQSSATVDVGKSLSPGLIILNQDQKVTLSLARLDGQPISPPQGVLNYAKLHGEERLTWQPTDSVRLATVVIYRAEPTPTYSVAVRNLRETERTETHLALMTMAAWLATLFATYAVVWLVNRSRN